MQNNIKSLASLSLDLDNQWSYMKTHGDAGWDLYPSYFSTLVPRVLQFLQDRNLKITFFVVGQDAALKKNSDMLRLIADTGHEIGNHSFKHEPWLHLYSREEIEQDLRMAHDSLAEATGQEPVGFRGPGFSLSGKVLYELENLGYEYDASVCPNLLMPLARAYYFMTTDLTAEEKRQRKQLGGTFKDGFRTLKPFQWELKNGGLTEIPVSTMPILKIPIHVSYLMALAAIQPKLAHAYFRFALRLCTLLKVQPSIVLHPTDFLTNEDTDSLSFYPGMQIRRERKLKIVKDLVCFLGEQFNVVGMREHAKHAAESKKLHVCTPDL